MIRLFTGVSCILICAAGALGQAQSQAQLDRFNQQLQETERRSRLLVDQSIPAGDRVLVDYGAFLTAAYFSLDDPTGRHHVAGQYELVGYADINFDGANEFFFRIHSLYNQFEPGNSFNGARDDYITPRIERAYYRFDLQRSAAAYQGKAISDNVIFTGGRQLAVWANGLTLNTTVDGVSATIASGPVSIDVLAGVTANFVTDFDTSRPRFRTDTRRGFYGAMVATKVGQQRFFAYGLDQQDYNDDPTLVANGIATRFKYRSFYFGAGAAGNLTDNFLYSVEGVYEGGKTLSNSFDNPASLDQVTQTYDAIQAVAFDGRLDYAVADPYRTRLSAETIVASGDGDRFNTNTTLGGNRPGGNDLAFNAFGLLNTGLSFAPSVSNLAMLRIGASTFPFSKTAMFRQAQIGADFFVFEKCRQNAPIDETTKSRRFLGSEADLYANWQITSDLSFVVRYGVFFAGPAITNTHEPRNFVYTGLTYAF